MSSVFDVPPGFRFKPAAEEIFKYYLCPAMKGEAFPCGILRECDVYEREPWHLFDKDPSQSFWVLTPLKKMSENKIQRTAGSGVWNGRGTVKKVRDSDGKVVGLQKFYNFIDTKTDDGSNPNPNPNRSKPKPKGDHEWNMNEYSLDEKGLNDPVLAVCEITYKPKPPSSSSSHDQTQTSSSHDHDQTQTKCCHDDDTDDHDEFIQAILANSSPPRFELPEIQPLAQLPDVETTFGNTSVDDHLQVIGSEEFQCNGRLFSDHHDLIGFHDFDGFQINIPTGFFDELNDLSFQSFSTSSSTTLFPTPIHNI
ncbi:No apical meristem (NAM) protein [Corchorus olitorius]|uniref:No apical meristem (NAM) protein n=1 Tax=Corchorus olitorius TaxID=93759 RepID=A0A1R3GSC1_9ROSI|nr:No apical meristem (NAM) protein [Corchorus olitorius]